MPTAPVIDVESLVQPVPGDDPAGGPLPGPAGEKLKEFREEFDPNDLDPSDPRRNDPSVQKKDANWQGVIDLGEETLKDVSKHLLVAVRMTEALTMRRGFAGARDGFRLLRRMAEDCWDRMYPKVEEPDDLEARAGSYEWLDDEKGGALYPNKLKTVPVLISGALRITVIAWKGFQGQPAEATWEQIAAAARASDPQQCQNMLDDVTAMIDEVNQLGSVLGDKMGSLAPSFYKVREALEQCRVLAQGIAQESAGAGGAPAAAGEVGGRAAAAGGGQAAGGVLTRGSIYAELLRLAQALQNMEPHSPVPFLIRQAVELQTIQFPDLVDELTKDPNVLTFLKRKIGPEEGGGG
jgi:type VI secretion system protein ImpA